MKIRILPLITAALMLASSFLSSCLKNDYEEFDFPSSSSINSFSLGTLRQTIFGKDSKGNDSIYTDTVSYAKIPFVIDQINRKIYNKEYLPHTVDISKALVRITSDTELICFNYQKDPFKNNDSILRPTDSLDLSRGLTLHVMTYSPTYKTFKKGKPYSVNINVYKNNPDSMVWKHFENTALPELTVQKAVYANNKLYVSGNGTIYSVASENGEIIGNWSEVSGTQDNVSSILAFNNDIYYVAGNKLFSLSNNTQLGESSNLDVLVSATQDSIMAYTTDKKIISLDKNGMAGKKTVSSDFDFKRQFYAISCKAIHNNRLWRTTVMSNSAQDSTANVFSYISSEKNMSKLTPNNPVTCPDMENVSMINYNGKFYAFGGKFKDKVKPFENFYFSNNNGFDWRIEPNKYMKFEPKVAELYNNEPYACVVETDNEGKESFIWFIWHNGKISRANLNKYAPNK